MKYVYIASYQSVFLALRLRIDHPVVAIVRDTALIPVLLALDLDFVQIDPEPTFRILDLRAYFRMHRRTLSFCETLSEGAELYFSYNGFDVSGFELVSTWAHLSLGPVRYFDFDPPRARLSATELSELLGCNLFYHLWVRLCLELICGCHGIVLVRANPITWGIDRRFLRINRVETGFWAETPSAIRSVVTRLNGQASEADAVFACDNTSGILPYVSSSSLESLVSKISLFPGSLVAKLHPFERNSKIYSSISFLESPLPTEFFLGDRRVVLSICSAVLQECLNRPESLFVSLIHLLEWEDKRQYQQYLAFVTSFSAPNLYVPANWNDYEAILRRLESSGAR